MLGYFDEPRKIRRKAVKKSVHTSPNVSEAARSMPSTLTSRLCWIIQRCTSSGSDFFGVYATFRKTLFAALTILLIPCFLPHAQAASSLDILDRERDRTRTEPLSRPIIRIDEDRKPSPVDATIQFTLGSLRIEGATVFTEAELLAPYAGLSGKRISFETLNSIAADLTKKYRDSGYLLSRVVLPAQEVDQAAANIRLAAIEGFISSIEYQGDAALVERFKSYAASVEQKLLGKKPLKHSEFEREMLLFQDLPGVEVSSRFQEAPVSGGSVLVLELKGDAVSGSVGWSNSGTQSAGPGILSASIGLNSLPLMGMQTTLSYTQADYFDEYYSIMLGESYRFSNGLTLRASYAYSSSPKPDTNFARLFNYETNSQTLTFGISYPLIRSRDMNLSIGMDYEHRDSNADLLNEKFTRDRLRTLSVNADFDFSDELGGVTQIIPTLYQGLDVFDATNHDSGSTNLLAGAQFFKTDIYLSRNQQLPFDFSIFTAAEAQFADSSLSSYNKFSFGGSQFGRGYDPGVIEGDNAFAVSLEPRWTYKFNDKLAIQPFAFIDWGTVWVSRSVEGVPDQEYGSSFGAGVRFWGHVGDDILPDFNISAFVGNPMERSGTGNTLPRFVLQVSLLF
jgi:hemolysin activation/secretion protein